MDHPYFQAGVAVQNLEQAMEELSAALGLEWIGPQDRDVGGMQFRVSFARTAPPYLELIEGGPGSPWDATGGPHLHHLGYWTDDKNGDMARLEAAGMTKEVTFEPVEGPVNDRIDDAYRAKYHDSPYLSPMIGPRARSATVKVMPRETKA